MAVTAMTTLFLAIQAIRTINESNTREQLERNERLQRENRDRKERYLNEIIQWANDVNTQVYDISILTGDRYNENRNTVWILISLANKSKYIRTIAEYIFGNPLKDSIKATGKAISIYGASLTYLVERKFEVLGIPDNERDIIVKELNEAIAEDDSSMGVTSFAMRDAIKRKFAESMRDKAIITLDICAELKDDLLIK